jgi:hypothetical protein
VSSQPKRSLRQHSPFNPLSYQPSNGTSWLASMPFKGPSDLQHVAQLNSAIAESKWIRRSIEGWD